MKVRYQIIVEVTADGMLGPLKVQNTIEQALKEYRVGIVPQTLTERGLILGQVRIAACYTLAPDDTEPMVTRVPGRDQSRPVEEVRDPQSRL